MRRIHDAALRRWSFATALSAPTNTHYILVPGPFGGLRLVVRQGPGAVRVGPFVIDGAHLRDLLHSPCAGVILCGSRHADRVVRAVHRRADVHIVPMRWFRRIPRDQPARMADRAVGLLAIHQTAPIQTIYR